MQRETELFVDSVFRENRSVLDLLTANYTFLNERLARHYGVPNVRGSYFRRVTFPDGQRARRPARAGQRADDHVVLDAHLAGAARQVGAREPAVGGAAASAGRRPVAEDGDGTGQAADAARGDDPAPRRSGLRRLPRADGSDRLRDGELRRVGRWRERDGEQPIDATGVFPDGTKFDGIPGLKRELLRQPEQFVGTVAERLLMYAIGRNLQYYDAPTVRAVMREAPPAKLHAGVAGARRREEPSVPDAGGWRVATVGGLDVRHEEGTARGGRSCEAMGTTVALPLLDAMVPALSARALKPTPRFGFVYIANGVIQNQWTPATTGAGFELTPTLQPFANVRNQITVLSGLSHLQADTFGDGTGDHPRASAVWLTGVHAYDRTRAGRRGEARDDGRSAHRPRDRQDVADPVARDVRRLPDAGLLRFGRLLLRQHRVVAERDDAEPHRVASAHRVRAAVRRRRQRRGAPGAQRSPRAASSIPSATKRAAWRAASAAATRPSWASISTRCARSSSGFRTPSRSRWTSSCPSGRPTSRHVRRAHQADVRPAGAGVPGRHHARVQHDHVARAEHDDLRRASACPSSTTACRTTATIPKLIAKKAQIDLYQAQLFAYFLEKLQATPDGDGSAARPVADALRRRHGRRQPAPALRSADADGRRTGRQRSRWAATSSTRSTRR